MQGDTDSPNVAQIRRAFGAFNARDVDELAAVLHPDGELYPYAIEAARASGYKGHDGLTRYIDDVASHFEEFHVEIEDFSEPAEHVVYARGRMVGRTHDGTDVNMPTGWLWSLEDGRVLRMQADPIRRPGD